MQRASSGAVFSDNQNGQVAYYAFVVFFPADAYGRMDAFSTACVVSNGTANLNLLSVRPN